MVWGIIIYGVLLLMPVIQVNNNQVMANSSSFKMEILDNKVKINLDNNHDLIIHNLVEEVHWIPI